MNSELLVNQYNNRPKEEAALKSFSVKNYRNLNIDKIRFNHDVNLFIGPNNSGKSNLIDAISFSSQIINSNKRESESAFLDELNKRNWGDLLNRKLAKPDKIRMNWVLETPSSGYPDLNYGLEFMVGDNQQKFYITDENLRFNSAARIISEPIFELDQRYDLILVIDDLDCRFDKDVEAYEDWRLSTFERVELVFSSGLYEAEEFGLVDLVTFPGSF